MTKPAAKKSNKMNDSELRNMLLGLPNPAPATVIATPTTRQFTAYDALFEHFNRKLFGGALPGVILNFSRKAKTRGFFAPRRWEGLADTAPDVRHEISLNPTTLKERTPREICSTLVHEMVHLWQEELADKKAKRGYHDMIWAGKMEEIGLMPTDTGDVGGKKTGHKVTHYIIDGGAFDVAFSKLSDAAFPWRCNPEPAAIAKPRNKVKYTCRGCECNVWGKPDLNLECTDCAEPFEAEV